MTRRWVAVCAGVTLASAVTAGLVAPIALADSLTDQRAAVAKQIAQSRSELTESSRSLARATVKVEHTQQRLDAARAELAQTRRELAEARRVDKAMAAKLTKAKAELAAAREAVRRGQAALDAQKAVAGSMVRDQYQKQTNLLGIAMVMGESTADLATRLQWATTMFDTAQAEIDRLEVLQAQLTAERARLARAEKAVADDRREAAAALRAKRALEQRARSQADRIAALLTQQRAEVRAAAEDVAADKSHYAKLQKERASVEHRIAVRIAKAKAAAKAAARRAALEKAAAAKRAAAAAKRAAERAKRNGGKSSGSGSSSGGSAGGGSTTGGSHSGGSHSVPSGMRRAAHGFAYPVNASITSPYGMRFHPVLKRWKLHDGTDFGAGCGTAIRAAYSGRVVERYYNAGYGNRLMIDHGYIDGRYVTTGYNHAIRYVVGVGSHVRQGQVIGYVGTTGYSTGCHLHLMVWLNGRNVNPMSWF